MDSHVRFAANLRMLYSGLLLAVGVVCLLVFRAEPPTSGNAAALGAALGLFTIWAPLSLIAGLGMRRYRPWARLLGILFAVLDLPSVPFGTALGAYSLWVLFHRDTARLFEYGGPAALAGRVAGETGGRIAGPHAPTTAPAGWSVESGPDGSTRVIRCHGWRGVWGACVLLFALFPWIGIVGIVSVAALDPTLRGMILPLVLRTTPLILFSAAWFALFLWLALGKEEWCARDNSLEVRRALFYHRWVRRYTGGTLVVKIKGLHGQKPGAMWALVVVAPGVRRTLAGGYAKELRTIGAILSERTGWPLRSSDW
jgi:hypothetical protein